MRNITVTVGGWLDSLSPAAKNKMWQSIAANADAEEAKLRWTIRMAGQHWE